MTRLIQIIIVLGALVLFGWTVWLNLTPGGVLVARYDFDAVSPFVTSLLPGGRALPITRNAAGEYYQGVIDEPVYFRLKSPRTFQQASVSITFQNPTHPLLEVGGLAARDPDIYDLKPLENKIIDALDWDTIWNADVTLYQRRSRYRTVEAFLANLPPRDQIATYHTRIDIPYHLPEYRPTETTQTIDTSLRGAHTFYAYVKNETLDVTFWVQDMDRDAGGDPVSITTYQEGAPVGTVNDVDTGAQEPGQIYPIHLAIPGLSEGAYRIEFRASRDVFIRKIETRAKKFVVQDAVFLGDEVGYRDGERPVGLWTTGRVLRALTLHADGAQELDVGNDTLRVAESHREYTHRILGSPPTEISSPQGDIQLRTNGFFAFSLDALFVPEPVRLSWDTNLDAERIDYILADYNPPQTRGDWKQGYATFDVANLLWEDGAAPFVISAPGIAALQNEVRIGEIEVRFEREPQSIREIIKELWQKIVQ